MSHYFTEQQSSQSNRREIPFRFFGMNFTLMSSDGIFSKDYIDKGTLILLETLLQKDLQGSLLDLGCGIGVVGIVMKMKHPHLSVMMSDVTTHATELALENVKRLNLDNRVILSDSFENIEETFDHIVLNPPIRAGKSVIYRLFEDSLHHLNPNGSLYIVMMKKHGLNSAIAFLKSKSCQITKLEHQSNYHVLEVNMIDKDKSN